MDYVKAENFLKQSEKVQKTLLDWWTPSIGDLATFKEAVDCFGRFKHYIVTKYNKEDEESKYIDIYGITLLNMFPGSAMAECTSFKSRFDVIPNLTEGQLRKFIEDKTGYTVEIRANNEGYLIILWSRKDVDSRGWYEEKTFDLIEAYWNVACKIA